MKAYHRDVGYRLDFIVIMVNSLVISFYKYSAVTKRRAVADSGFKRRDLSIFNTISTLSEGPATFFLKCKASIAAFYSNFPPKYLTFLVSLEHYRAVF